MHNKEIRINVDTLIEILKIILEKTQVEVKISYNNKEK